MNKKYGIWLDTPGLILISFEMRKKIVVSYSCIAVVVTESSENAVIYSRNYQNTPSIIAGIFCFNVLVKHTFCSSLVTKYGDMCIIPKCCQMWTFQVKPSIIVMITMSSLPYYHGTCITSTHYMVFNSARKTEKVLKMKYDGEQNL